MKEVTLLFGRNRPCIASLATSDVLVLLARQTKAQRTDICRRIVHIKEPAYPGVEQLSEFSSHLGSFFTQPHNTAIELTVSDDGCCGLHSCLREQFL
jgi:hypothetical protein